MIPFAVVGSDQEYQVNGRRLLGRKTKWGTIEGTDPPRPLPFPVSTASRDVTSSARAVDCSSSLAAFSGVSGADIQQQAWTFVSAPPTLIDSIAVSVTVGRTMMSVWLFQLINIGAALAVLYHAALMSTKFNINFSFTRLHSGS